MYLIAIAWLYVALMMAVAEATHSNGSVLGALITFVFYGAVPVALAMYLLGTPMRRRARRAAEQREALAQEPVAEDERPADAGSSPLDPDRSSHAPAGAVQSTVAPVREEP